MGIGGPAPEMARLANDPVTDPAGMVAASPHAAGAMQRVASSHAKGVADEAGEAAFVQRLQQV